MINVQVPVTLNIYDLQSILLEIQRRSVDGTVVPLFVDYVNQRVIIGATVSAGSGAAFQVNGDVEIFGTSKGVILKDDGGTSHTCRVTATYDASSQNWTLNLTTVS